MNKEIEMNDKPVTINHVEEFRDVQRKLAAVRELRDATAALCHPPVPTDDDPMSQGAWAARREVVDALNALLDGEATS